MLLRTETQVTINNSRHILIGQVDAVVCSKLQLLSQDLDDLIAIHSILTQSKLHRLAISQCLVRVLVSYFKAESAV